MGFWPVGFCPWDFVLWDFGLWDYVPDSLYQLVGSSSPALEETWVPLS